jgi:hypothetical protein
VTKKNLLFSSLLFAGHVDDDDDDGGALKYV